MPLQLELPWRCSSASPDEKSLPQILRIEMNFERASRLRTAILCYPQMTRDAVMAVFLQKYPENPTAEQFDQFLRDMVTEGLRLHRKEQAAKAESAKAYLAPWRDGTYSNH